MSTIAETQVLAFLTYSKMDEIANSIGYTLKGDFLRGEFDSLVLEATDVALRHLNPSNCVPASSKCLKQAVQSCVKEQFEKVCRVQKNISLPELDLPGTWRHYLRSWWHSQS
jgi:hypothetical protein